MTRTLYCNRCQKWLVEYDDTTDTIIRQRRFVRVTPIYEPYPKPSNPTPHPTRLEDPGYYELDKPEPSTYWMKDFDPDVADLVARGIMVEPAPEPTPEPTPEAVPERPPENRRVIGVTLGCNCNREDQHHGYGQSYGGLTPAL